MFNQDKFANILKKINESYDTMTDFGKSASFDRTYISKYINKKLSNPPTPKILEKIAKASKGITTYSELMQICGYININEYDSEISIYARNNKIDRKVDILTDLSNCEELSDVEEKAFNEISNIIIDYTKDDKKINLDSIISSQDCIYNNLTSTEQKNVLKYLNALLATKNYIENEYIDELGNPVVKIPLLGVVKAGYDYLAQENWIGTVDVDKKLADSGEFFALKVHGDSMFPTLMEDDIVIIKKQDDFENGDIVVAIINGDEATIKKGKKSDVGILLQPLNNDYEPLIFTYDEMKSIPVTIIGVVKQLKREF